MGADLDFQKILDTGFKKRKNLNLPGNALRILDGEADGVPGLSLDQFDQHYLIQIFRPESRKMAFTLAKALQTRTTPNCLVLKDRTERSGESLQNLQNQVLLGKGKEQTIICEGRARAEVDLLDTANPGVFLDMRANRFELARRTSGGSLLNLFSYTCMFGLQARLHGAKQVVNVDISARALEQGRRNYKRSGVREGEGEFRKMEAGAYLSYCIRKEIRFSTIVIDPPSFARLKKGTFRIQRDLPKLIEDAFFCLDDRGIIFVSTNHSQTSSVELEKICKSSASSVRKKIARIERRGKDRDFLSKGKTPYNCLAACLVETV